MNRRSRTTHLNADNRLKSLSVLSLSRLVYNSRCFVGNRKALSDSQERPSKGKSIGLLPWGEVQVFSLYGLPAWLSLL